MNINTIWRTAKKLLNLAAGNALTAINHPRGVSGWLTLNRTGIRYDREVTPEANSIVIACVRWVQRVFSEAPMMLQQWLKDRAEWEDRHVDDLLHLLERPNTHYNGTALWKATIADLMLNGTAYWIKVRSQTGRVVQLWWAPESIVTPKGDPNDPTVFISYYQYSPSTNSGSTPTRLRTEDVIQFRDGIDPADVRKGLSGMKALLREIFTDDEAANMTASLLRNMGVPGVIISPKAGTIDKDAAIELKETFMEKFSGDAKGEPLVLGGDATVQQFGFSPQQMGGRDLRGVPEERITAVLGVNAAVVGLGAGLASTKVGATLREYREEAFESTIIPMYRDMAAQITQQLVDDFHDSKTHRLAFDLTKVRVLQEDELKRSERVSNLTSNGVIKVSEARRALGFPVEEEHEIWLIPANLQVVAAGSLLDKTRQEPDRGSQAMALRRFMASRDLFRVPATLVAGPPGSGKTAYVMERAERGDLIIDVDKLFVAFSGLRSHDHPDELLPFVLSARDASEDRLGLSNGVRHAWIIKGAPRKAQRQDMARRGAAVVVLDVPAEECLNRIANDPERQGLDCPWDDWINQWWEDYEPDDSQSNDALATAGFTNGNGRGRL